MTAAPALATPQATVPTPVFRTELDGNSGVSIRVFQIENELGEIFNRVNIVVRRRRNQRYAWRGTARFRDPRIHFAAWQMTAFATAWRPAPS